MDNELLHKYMLPRHSLLNRFEQRMKLPRHLLSALDRHRQNLPYQEHRASRVWTAAAFQLLEIF